VDTLIIEDKIRRPLARKRARQNVGNQEALTRGLAFRLLGQRQGQQYVALFDNSVQIRLLICFAYGIVVNEIFEHILLIGR
jgi:hypothetical protein